MPGVHSRSARERARRVVLIAALVLPLAGCGEQMGNPNPPDALLQDSLGLSADDRVHRVVMGTRDGAEFVDPVEVTLEPGGFVEFFAEDRRVRTVSFLADSLSSEQADFLRARGQDRSPPLLELESRYLVTFEDAPLGRYPFVVEGNARRIFGAVVVGSP
jgi:plastocyanin